MNAPACHGLARRASPVHGTSAGTPTRSQHGSPFFPTPGLSIQSRRDGFPESFAGVAMEGGVRQGSLHALKIPPFTLRIRPGGAAGSGGRGRGGVMMVKPATTVVRPLMHWSRKGEFAS